MPKGWNDWKSANAEKIKEAQQGKRSMPWFLKDNMKQVEDATGLSLEQRKGMFGRRNKKAESQTTEIPNVKEIPIMEDKQRENTETFLKKLGYSDEAIKAIKPMPFEEADQGKANYSRDMDNCQLCAPTLLARLRGINISAPYYTDGGFAQMLSNDMRLAFSNSANLKTIKFTADKKPVGKMIEKLEKTFANLPNDSIHHFGYDWRTDGEEGHIWTVIKTENKLFIVDGQEKRGINNRLKDIIPQIDFKNKVELLRVDDLEFSEDFMNFLSKKQMRKR